TIATIGTFIELGITLERAISVRDPEKYHNSKLARKNISVYLGVSICASIFLGSLMIKGAQTTSAMISTFLLNCLDISSFVVSILI
ncbi:hypothetical protein PMAYCL1PPCAC_21296, partial [Pristionchus mayeri]